MLGTMKRHSPTLEGFRAILRRPSFGLAEIAWRWSFGLAAGLLLVFSFLEYLDTLPVTRGSLFLLRTRQPVLISRALAHIFRGSGLRVVTASIVLALGFAVIWIAIASLGRAITVRALIDYFREGSFAGEGARATQPAQTLFWQGSEQPGQLRSLIGLNFFRVGGTLAAAVGCLGASLLAAAASPARDPSPGSAVLIFLMLVMFVCLAWGVLNWFLSLAAVFVLENGRDTFSAVAAAVDLCRDRTGSVLAAGTWFGLAHLVAFFIASSVVAFPLAFAGVLPAGVVLGGVLLVTLLYFAVVDFLYIGRLAAFVAILELPEAPLAAVPQFPPQTRVDPDELILSDFGSAPA